MKGNTMSKFESFTRGRAMASTSFDFDGAIVPVCLATERGKIAESDSKLLASRRLSDLWQAAKLRGKRGAGYTKPFPVYTDDFQNYLTSTIIQQLNNEKGGDHE
jgi:hypothetical protein